MEGILKYIPGFEPDHIRKELDELFSMIDKEFPDKKIDPKRWKHDEWDGLAGRLQHELGYSKGRYFLSAYGYSLSEEWLAAERVEAERREEELKSMGVPIHGKIVKILKYGKSGFIRSLDGKKDYYFNVRDFVHKVKVLEVGREVTFCREEKNDFKNGEKDICAVKIEYVEKEK